MPQIDCPFGGQNVAVSAANMICVNGTFDPVRNPGRSTVFVKVFSGPVAPCGTTIPGDAIQATFQTGTGGWCARNVLVPALLGSCYVCAWEKAGGTVSTDRQPFNAVATGIVPLDCCGPCSSGSGSFLPAAAEDDSADLEEDVADRSNAGSPTIAPSGRSPRDTGSTAIAALPCVRRNGPTGEAVLCPSCSGHVELKLLSCAVHGRCTPTRPVPGVACCQECADYQPAAFRRHLLYYVYPRRGGMWRWNVNELLQRIALFDGRRIIAIAQDRTCDSAVYVMDALHGQGCEFVVQPNDPDLREVAAFETLWGRVADLGAGDAVLFAHAKGVTRPADSTARRWTAALYETHLDYWPLVARILGRHPLAGSFKKLGRAWSAEESRSDWHFSGSWLWFRAGDVFRRPDWRRIDRFWSGIEPWPSLHFGPRAAGVIFHEGPVAALNLYDHRYWDEVVEPALTAWRERHHADCMPVPFHAIN